MPRGDKSSYSGKQRRQAEHIEESYAQRGAGRKKAERIAWATVNKQDGGAKGRNATPRGGKKSPSKAAGTTRAGGRAGSRSARSSASR